MAPFLCLVCSLRNRTGPDPRWRPLLTSSRAVMDEGLQRRPWEAVKRLAACVFDTICERIRAPKSLKRVLIAYYSSLCLLYVIAYACVLALALRVLVLLAGLLRIVFYAALAKIMLSEELPRILIALFSKTVAKRRDPPSDMTEIRVYHGTTAENAASIRAEGFRASSAGMLGRGVYVSRDINKVLAYGGHNGVILELRVVLGKVCVVDRQGHENQQQWHSAYDTAWVPAKCGMVGSGLEEGCIAKLECVKLVRVWQRHHPFLLLLFAYEVTRLMLDACLGLWGCRRAHAPDEPPPPQLPDSESPPVVQVLGPLATCSDLQRFTHATVPPQLAHKIKRG